MSSETAWNGEPCIAARVTVTVADSGTFPQYWARDLVGTRRNAVRVEYGGNVFHLDDQDGSGWDKVTHGGGPGRAHRSLEVEAGTEQLRIEQPDQDTRTPGMNGPQPPRLNRAARRALARRKR